MRSIRHGIPTSGRTVNARFPGSFSLAATPPILLTLWKGKKKASKTYLEGGNELGLHKGPPEHTTGPPHAISEFETITRMYDDAEYRAPEIKRTEPRQSPKSMIRRFEDFHANSRLPPVPLRERRKWLCAGEKNSRALGARPGHVPIPLTFGSGAVEGRLQRYQQTLKQRGESLQAVVEALKPSGDIPLHGSSEARVEGEAMVTYAKASRCQNLPPIIIGKRSTSSPGTTRRSFYTPGNALLAPHSSQKYGAPASINEPIDWQGLPGTVTRAAVSDSTRTESGEPHNVPHPDVGASSQTKVDVIDEFITSWPGEKWENTWGIDQLAPSSDHDYPRSSSSHLEPPGSAPLRAVTRHKKRPGTLSRALRHTNVRSIVGPSKTSLSRRLLTNFKLSARKMRTDQHNTVRKQPMDRRVEHRLKDEVDRSQSTAEDADGTQTTPLDKPTNQQLKPSQSLGMPESSPRDRLSTEPSTGVSEKIEASDSGTKKRPLSKKGRKIRALGLKAETKKKYMAGISATMALKRKETKTKRKKMKAEAREAAIKGVLKPLSADVEVLEDVVPPYESSAVPRLAHGLDRVLFNPSVHWVQDPHSRVYNFPPNLQALPAVTEFAFERLGPYVSSSRDESLHSLALRHRKPFAGSTSSLTSFLSHIYFLISGDRPVDTSTLSMAFQKEPRTFTPGIRLPAQVVFHHRRYQANDGDKPILTSFRGHGGNPNFADHNNPDPAEATRPPRTGAMSDVIDAADTLSTRMDAGDASTDALLELARNPGEEASVRPDTPLLDPSRAETEPIPSVDTRDGTIPMEEAASLNGPASLPPDPPLPNSATSTGATEAAEVVESSNVSEGLLHTPNSHDPMATQVDVTSENHLDSGRFLDTYAIDSGTGDPDDRRISELNVLLWLGTMAEKFLTLPEAAFTALLRKNPANDVEPKRNESYRYAKSSQFVMRSQLDCQDTRLPGTGVFDIKTRAVLPVRLDRFNYLKNAGYLIRKMTGLYESFEREYYDLIRGAFLKYNFQARIGNMDGVFVAYHNTARMFGFQYVPVTEMEERVYGLGSPGRGAKIFEKCIRLLEVLCDEVVACFPAKSVSCLVEARQGAGNLKIWVWPTSGCDPKPIAELTVTVYHTINGRFVNSKTAIDRADEDWQLHYSISRSSKPASKIWTTLREVQSREFASALPEGVSKEDMLKRLALVNFGAGKGLDEELPEEKTKSADEVEVEVEVKSKFAKASSMVRHLRRLARQGWEDLKREEDEGAAAAAAAQQHVIFGAGAGELRGADKEPIQPSTVGSVYPESVGVDSQYRQGPGGATSVDDEETEAEVEARVQDPPPSIVSQASLEKPAIEDESGNENHQSVAAKSLHAAFSKYHL